jgi:hypothetical protein
MMSLSPCVRKSIATSIRPRALARMQVGVSAQHRMQPTPYSVRSRFQVHLKPDVWWPTQRGPRARCPPPTASRTEADGPQRRLFLGRGDHYGSTPPSAACNAYLCPLEILHKVNRLFYRSSCSGIVVETSYRNHCVILICTEGKSLTTIAVLLLSLILVDAAFASIIGQMKGIFVCDTKGTYDQAVDMIRQHNWDAVDRLVLSGRCTQINKGDVVVENVTSLTGLVRVHARGKTTSWWASAEEVNR